MNNLFEMPDIPDSLRIPQEERRLSWAGRELRPTRDFAPMVIGRTVIEDAGTASVRAEVEAAARARRERDLIKKRDDEAVRQRGIKNQRIIKLAADGKIELPPAPVKIIRVIDLNPQGIMPAIEETDVKKASVKKKLPNTHPAVRGAKKRAKPRTGAKRQAKASARTPVAAGEKKVSTVQVIADMMARPAGHPDAPLGGASMAEMVEAIDVEPHPMRAKIKAVRDRLGYTTEAPSKANGQRYFAKPPKG